MFKAIYEDPNIHLTWPKVLIIDKAERDHQKFKKHSYIHQDAVDFFIYYYLRDVNFAIKKALKNEKIIAKPSVKHHRPIGFDESQLTYKDSVLYLLEPRELEFGRRRITDMNWSSKVYHIKESLIQKNQLVLYWLIDENRDGFERSFVNEQLIKVGKVVYPPKWILKQY
ncbi:1776_t:CDS:2 [Cetraspora pellucida]|uniref:1776_t:CDS:1 n=1 Tax=Cetraspora pellucida TaxID=1433469 RepID=A0A9N9CLG5_9GLOM|nr:1776_t:CDS:2 [Cetraspora pellucida]